MSRQSSILKPSKQRLPLQCVVSNPSSSENSPTVKIKRRVSFAKNRRIKEFCNEIEQGAGWDSTYEEHDLSSTKSSSNSTHDHPIIIQVPCQDKENFPVQLFMPHDEINCTEISTPIAAGENNSLCSDDSFDNVIPGQKVVEDTDETIYCNDGMDLTTSIPSSTPCSSQENHFSDDDAAIANKLLNKSDNMENASIDLTQAISTILAVGNFRAMSNKDSNMYKHSQDFNTFKNKNCDTGDMELTSVLPSSTWVRQDSQSENAEYEKCDKTKNINVSMELTEALVMYKPREGLNNSQIIKKVSESSSILNNNENYFSTQDETHNFVNRSVENGTVFKDLHMEMVEPTKFENSKSKLNKSTNDFSNNLTMKNTTLSESENCENGTEYFNNKCVSETIPIQQIAVNESGKNKCVFESYPENTMAIPVQQVTINTRSTQKAPANTNTFQENTKIVFNRLMDISETIPQNEIAASTKSDQEYFSISNGHKNICGSDEKTHASYNKLKDISETIPVQQLIARSSSQNSPFFKEDNFTHPRSNVDSIHSENKSSQFRNEMNNTNRTEYFNNKSISEIISIPQVNISGNSSQEYLSGTSPEKAQVSINTKTISKIPLNASKSQEKTRVFNNRSMDISETMPVHQVLVSVKNVQEHLLNSSQEKTRVFDGKAMDISETMPVHQVLVSGKNVQENLLNSSQEKTRVFDGKAMDISETMPVHQVLVSGKNVQEHLLNSPQEKTRVFDGKAMDISETMPVHQVLVSGKNVQEHLLNSSQEKTRVFDGKAMDISETAAVQIHFPVLDVQKSIYQSEEKTRVFNNRSMDISETIPVQQLIAKSGSKNIPDLKEDNLTDPRSIIDAIHSKNITSQFCNKMNNVNRTEYFDNKSISETVPFPQINIYKTSNQECLSETSPEGAQVFLKRSPEVLETIAMQQVAIDTKNMSKVLLNASKSQEETRVFSNRSMDISETMPVHHGLFSAKIDQEISSSQEKTEMFDGKAMDVSETAPVQIHFPILRAQKNICQFEEKTRVFNNRSMDISETMPIQQKEFHEIFHKQDRSKISEKPTGCLVNKLVDIPDLILVQTEEETYKNNQKENVVRNSLISNSDIKATTLNPVFQKTFDGMNESLENTILLDKNNSSKVQTLLCTPSNSSNLSQNIMRNVARSPSRVVSKDTSSANKYINSKSLDLDKQTRTMNISKGKINKVSTKQPQVYNEDSVEHVETPYVLSGFVKNSMKPNQCNSQYSGCNTSNFAKSFCHDVFDKYSMQEMSFHRITSEELNTLCASMNLPSQKYSKEINSTAHNSYIKVCNDVNILRDSLKNNTLFHQQEPTAQNKSSVKNRSILPAMNSNDLDKSLNSRSFCDMEIDNYELARDTACSDLNLSCIHNNLLAQSGITQNDFDTTHTRTNFLHDSPTATENLRENDQTNTRFSKNNLMDKSCNKTHHAPEDNIFDKDFVRTKMNSTAGALSNIYAQDKNLETIKKPINVHNSFLEHKQSSGEEVTCNLDVSMELTTSTSPGSRAKRKFTEDNELPSSCKRISIRTNASSISQIPMEQNSYFSNPADNSLSRLPSDNTDLLIATMGFKTHLPYPLIINEKTTMKLSNKSLKDKLLFEKEKSFMNLSGIDVDTNIIELPPIEDETEVFSSKNHISQENEEVSTGVSTVMSSKKVPNNNEECMRLTGGKDSGMILHYLDKSDECNKRVDAINGFFSTNQNKSTKSLPSLEDCNVCMTNNESDYLGKKNESIQDHNTLLEKSTDDLEEIQPPSFLCSDSTDNESLTTSVITESVDKSNMLHQESINRSFDNDLSKLLDIEAIYSAAGVRRSMIEAPVFQQENTQEVEEECTQYETYNESTNLQNEPASPLASLLEKLETHVAREDCIWSIRDLNESCISVDFISKSFVIFINLCDTQEMDCIQNVGNVEVKSLLKDTTKNIFLKIVHNLLLIKLQFNEVLTKCKVYEDVLPLLDYISNEVIVAMNFMFDLQKLDALNLMNITDKRITIKVASKRRNIILEISLEIKAFDEIVPDDIRVRCILGNIKISDIKQLIVNIKKNYKFLSRYLKDVTDYITLIEDSMCLCKY